jgi:hypothetical protein
MKPMGAVERQRPVPHPDDKPDLPGKARRRPSHFRKKRKDTTTKVVRVLRNPTSEHRGVAGVDRSRIVPRSRVRQDQWNDVVNPAPALPDPSLHRPIPPPAPLPSEAATPAPNVPGSLDEPARRKRLEDIVGTVVLALMVAAMLVAMWLRMTES